MTKVKTFQRSENAEPGPLTNAKKGVGPRKEIKKEKTGKPREFTEKKKDANDEPATEKVYRYYISNVKFIPLFKIFCPIIFYRRSFL